MLPKGINAVYFHLGSEEAHKPERALAAELGISGQVRFIGSHPDPRYFHWAADVFVMPSLYEGLGIAALEAIAAGVPAILSRVDGLSDIIAELRHVKATPTLPESVASALTEIAAMDTGRRLSDSREDSQLIRTKFSQEAGVRSNVENLYVRG
jgi:glycosyltransferase involved in cell wall biosynthesis